MTIYQQTPGALMAQPGRSVTTFPSGLVRVDQTYICATADAATHRATLAVGNAMPDGDDYPSLETLAIHPEAQEIRRGDGFTEFRASSYGQTTSPGAGTNRTLSNIQLLPFVILSGAMTGSPYDASVDVYFTLRTITGMVVVPSGDSLNLSKIDYDAELGNAVDFYQTEGSLLNYIKVSDSAYDVTLESGLTGRVRLSDPTMQINSYTNFGRFSEVSVSITRGTIITAFV